MKGLIVRALKFFFPLILMLVLAFGTSSFGDTLSVVDLYTTDLNTIEDQEYWGLTVGDVPVYMVYEIYNETHLIP